MDNEIDRSEQKAERDYTRKPYQNLMTIIETLEEKAPLPMTKKQLKATTGLSTGVVFDVCWNLTRRGWAEETGDGAIRMMKSTSDKDAWVGRMVKKVVEDGYGLRIDSEQ